MLWGLRKKDMCTAALPVNRSGFRSRYGGGLSGFTELDVPASEIDISGATEKLEQTIDIVPYLPEGIKLVDETANNVVVTVSIEQEGTRTIELLAESIRVNNVQDNLRVSFEDNTDIQLQFKGAQEALEKLDVKMQYI